MYHTLWLNFPKSQLLADQCQLTIYTLTSQLHKDPNFFTYLVIPKSDTFTVRLLSTKQFLAAFSREIRKEMSGKNTKSSK